MRNHNTVPIPENSVESLQLTPLLSWSLRPHARFQLWLSSSWVFVLRFFIRTSNFVDYLTPKSFLWKNSSDTISHMAGVVVVFGWVLWHINLCRLFNAKSIFIQIISSISNNSVLHEYTVWLSKHFCFKLFSLVKQF